MMTRDLWAAIQRPPVHHPLFQRITGRMPDGHVDLYSALIQGQIWFWPLVFVLDMRLLILMLTGSTCCGAFWSLGISSAIVNEKGRSTYDLLALSPSGRLGMTWAICTGCLHRGGSFAFINSNEAWAVRLILFIPVIISAQIFAVHIFDASAISIAWVLALLILLATDHIQSIILASLLGALGPQRVTTRVDARLWSLSAFLTVQILSYALFMLGGTLILPSLYRWAHTEGLYAELSLPLLNVVLWMITRELLIRSLWTSLSSSLDATESETLTVLHEQQSVERIVSPDDDFQIMASTSSPTSNAPFVFPRGVETRYRSPLYERRGDRY